LHRARVTNYLNIVDTYTPCDEYDYEGFNHGQAFVDLLKHIR